MDGNELLSLLIEINLTIVFIMAYDYILQYTYLYIYFIIGTTTISIN